MELLFRPYMRFYQTKWKKKTYNILLEPLKFSSLKKTQTDFDQTAIQVFSRSLWYFKVILMFPR